MFLTKIISPEPRQSGPSLESEVLPAPPGPRGPLRPGPAPAQAAPTRRPTWLLWASSFFTSHDSRPSAGPHERVARARREAQSPETRRGPSRGPSPAGRDEAERGGGQGRAAARFSVKV